MAAREKDRAQMFADHHGINTVYGSYEELAADGDISELPLNLNLRLSPMPHQ